MVMVMAVGVAEPMRDIVLQLPVPIKVQKRISTIEIACFVERLTRQDVFMSDCRASKEVHQSSQPIRKICREFSSRLT